MGDRSPATVTVYDCPEEQATALHKVITAYFEQVEWDAPAPPDVLLIGTPYTDHEMNLSLAGELGPLMIQAAPGSSFCITSDPYCEYPGDEWNYTPLLGPACYPIDGDSNIVWSLNQIEALIEKSVETFGSTDGTVDSVPLIRAFRTAMGDDYHEAFSRPISKTEITVEV